MITGAPAPSPTFLGSDSFLLCGRRRLRLRLPVRGLTRWGERLRWPPESSYFPSCGRLAFGCGSPVVDSRAGASACGGHPNPRTSHLVVASPSAAAPRSWTHALGRAPAVATRTLVLPILWSPRLRLRLPGRGLTRWGERLRWPPEPSYFPSCGRLAFGCGSPFVDSRAGASACGGHPNPRTSHLVVASPSAAAPRSWTHALGRAPAVATRTLVLPILWSPRLRLRLPVRPSPLTLGRHRQWTSGHSYFLSRGRLAFGCGSPYVPRLSPWGGLGSGRPDTRTSYRVVASPSAAAPRTSLASHPGAALAVTVRTLALPIAWSPRLRLRLPLHYRPDDPGGEFLFADAGELALRSLARGDRHDLLEDLPSHLRQRRALEDDAAVDIHVLLHVAVHERVGGELDRGHGLAAEHRAAAGGEADEVAAAGHETGDGDGIVPRRVHEDEAARGDRLAVEEHVGHRGGTALGHAAQRLLEDRGDASRLVAGGGIVVHALDDTAAPPPPHVAIN